MSPILRQILIPHLETKPEPVSVFKESILEDLGPSMDQAGFDPGPHILAELSQPKSTPEHFLMLTHQRCC